DFSLSIGPSSGFASYRGASVNATVAGQRTFGPTHSVQYSCTGLPAGATCTFTPPTGSPTSTANLTLATSSSTPAGTYVVSVQATDGTITRTSGFTLTVGDPLLAYNDGTRPHAAGFLRSGLAELYVDGVLVARDTTNPITSVRLSTGVRIGRVASDFVGDIDEVLVYERALSDVEIAALAPPPPADGPVLRYDMETLLSDGRMKDLSGHVNHGTITGTTDIAGKVGRARHFRSEGHTIALQSRGDLV